MMNHNPAIEKRIKRDRKRRIDDIIQAAQRVILQKNYSGATMEDIATEAGITKPTIYQYFKTKDDLFIKMIKPLLTSLATKLESIHRELEENKYSSGRDIIHDVFNVYYDTFEENPDSFVLFNTFLQVGIMNQLNAESSSILKELELKSFEEGNSIIRLAIKQGFFHETDISRATDLTWATFWGIVQLEQSRWKKDGISSYIKPVLKLAEGIFIKSIVRN